MKNAFIVGVLTCFIVIGFISDVLADEPPAIDAIIDVDPNVFNLKSKGKWATVYIEFSDTCTYDVGQIDAGSVVLSVNGYNISAESKYKIKRL